MTARWKRLFYYLLINVFVSTCTVVTVLTLYERFYRQPGQSEVPIEIVVTTVVPDIGQSSSTPSISPPALTSTPVLEVYQVEAGDTLSNIADVFDVSVEDIMQINGLEDPNSLGVGDVLLIPLEPMPEPSPTETPPQPTMTPPQVPDLITQTQLPPGSPLQVEIDTVVGAGVLEDERVLVKYTGEGQLSLENWWIEDQEGSLFVFPRLNLFQDGAVSVYTKSGVDTVVELYWGLEEPVWEEGETVTLRDPEGEIRSTYQIP